jgi:dolichyl-phosphate-mannose--protein O-mannosyl transferase
VPTLLQKLNRPAVAIIAVGLIAGVLRFTHLSYPSERIFDEVYYSKSACIFLGYSDERCAITSSDEEFWRNDKNDTGAWVHPPLGKWAIAFGELAFGTNSFGWRFSSAVAGTASVVFLAIILQLLFGSPIWTFTGGLLLATEGLNFVQSRVAMLDIFVTFWIVLTFLLLLLDRRWIDRRTPIPIAASDTAAGGAGAEATPEPPAMTDAAGAALGLDPGSGLDAALGLDAGSGEEVAAAPIPPTAIGVPSPLWRPWRLATGVALGAAVATKWSGLTAVFGVIVLSLMWEIARRRRAGMHTRRALWRTIQFESFPIVVFFLAVPVVVYYTSYIGWFLHFGWSVDKWIHLQADIANYHAHLKSVGDKGKPIHPYLAQAWKWILLWRPVLYFAKYDKDVRHVIYANGNPAIFWGSIIAIPYAGYAWWKKREWRAGYVVLTITALYLPWFLVTRPQFSFYATPITPFFVLACVYALRDLSEAHIAGSRSRPWLPVAVGFVIVSVGLFFWFWPALTGGPLSGTAWQMRAWLPSWI